MGTATAKDIKRWVMDGLKNGSTHTIIFWDKWDNYPVYVKKDQDVNKVIDKYIKKDNVSLEEVYNNYHRISIEEQLKKHRAMFIYNKPKKR